MTISLKSVCCLWTLVVILQHALSFNLTNHCFRRCLRGRGGILCKCNAMHFSGKRSYDPKQNARPIGWRLPPNKRHDLLFSILNRPDFPKRLLKQLDLEHERDLSLAKSHDKEGLPNAIRPYINSVEDDIADAESREKNGKIERESDTVLDLSKEPLLHITDDKGFGGTVYQQWKSSQQNHAKMTQKLAQLVKDIWHEMTPAPISIDTPASASGNNNKQVDFTAEKYDNKGDNLNTNDKPEDGIISSINEAHSRTEASLARTLRELISQLPNLVHHYSGHIVDSNGQNSVAMSAANGVDADLRSQNDVSALMEENNAEVWNRIMQSLSRSVELKE